MNKKLKITFRYLLLLLLFQLLQTHMHNLQAQVEKKAVQKIIVASVPLEKIDNYRQDNDFKYIKQNPAVNLGGIILNLLTEFLKMAFSDQGVAPYVRYIVIILVIAFVISKIRGGNFSGIFNTNLQLAKKNSFGYTNDNIHKINFEKEIKNAVSNQNYRLATRFLYLKLLKILNETNYIDWKVGKTNSRYLHELKDTNISNSFKQLSGMYEYSWYGHFELNHAEFEQLSKQYENTFLSLNAH